MTRRRTPLAASRRYYPGFFAALFLVLLRVAIGWHFLYEGVEKFESIRKGTRPFTAEPYLRNATGPLAPYFRGMVPDVNGLAKLDPARLKASWAAEVDRLADHYRFDQKQRDEAKDALQQAESDAEVWFNDKENVEDRSKYLHQLAQVQAVESNPKALSFERERAAERRKDLDAQRKTLVGEIDAIGDALRDALVNKVATPEQREAAGPYRKPMTSLDWVNLSTTYGLIAMGIGLILGLFTPLAALAGAVFLGQIYLSMPPWPGLPASPVAEGHYWIVNKNLIEMLACLALVFIPTGRWVGIDAALFGWLGRNRRARQAAAEEAGRGPDAGPWRPVQPADTGPIPIDRT
jgi:uncharacterized membrane protein YphA (DoxX/SURF4 family)